MKVLFDSQIFDQQSHGGISRFFVELFRHLPKHIEQAMALVETDNVYLTRPGLPHIGDTQRTFTNGHDSWWWRMRYKMHYQFKYGKYSQWDKTPNLNRLEQERLFAQKDFDVFHPTYFDPYFLPMLGKKPFVLTVHDMIPELYSQYSLPGDKQAEWKRQVIPHATHIVTVSEHTRHDLIRLMHVPEEKISVIPHGVDETPYTPSVQRPFDFEYILFVGGRYLYKNFNPFCRACQPVLKRHSTLKIVCTGLPFSDEEKQYIDSLGLSGRFVQIFVDGNQQLLDLYHHAVAFVFPSEYEGFGLPILEAYKADCPVMLNHASCFPEVAGDAAIYFHINEQHSDFEEQFETLYHLDANERSLLLARQRKQLERYSWTTAAQNYAQVYETVK